MTVVLPGTVPTLTRVTVAQPSAGADWSYTVPANTWLRLLAGFATLVTSATAANRYLGWKFADSAATPLGETQPILTVPASSTQAIHYAHCYVWDSAGQVFAGCTLIAQCISVIYRPGDVFGSATPNMDTADQYSSIQLWLEQWTSQPMWDGGTVHLA